MKKFIAENLKYPKVALENKVEGTVHLDYKLNHKGEVIDSKVISGLGNGCDEEALRLVKLLKFEPARNRKLKVTFNKKIQIHFRLPKQKPIASVTEAIDQYNYVLKPKPKSKPKALKKTTPPKKYSYTITVNF
jgi:protein TonB